MVAPRVLLVGVSLFSSHWSILYKFYHLRYFALSLELSGSLYLRMCHFWSGQIFNFHSAHHHSVTQQSLYITTTSSMHTRVAHASNTSQTKNKQTNKCNNPMFDGAYLHPSLHVSFTVCTMQGEVFSPH